MRRQDGQVKNMGERVKLQRGRDDDVLPDDEYIYPTKLTDALIISN
mgnify:CR=1 FL=1